MFSDLLVVAKQSQKICKHEIRT